MEARDIIIRPLVTEMTTELMEEGKAVSTIFNVKVESVNTVNVLGKVKRMGRNLGKRSDYKKAIVKLAAGETIEFFQA